MHKCAFGREGGPPSPLKEGVIKKRFSAENRHWRRVLGLQHHLYDQFFTLIPILTELRPNSAKNGSKSTIFIFHSKNAFFKEVF